MSYQYKNVLVTGGAGFIGSNFIRYLLAAEAEVRIVNLDLLTYAGHLENLEDLPATDRHVFVRGDICDREQLDALLREHAIDTVVHFAAESHVDRSIIGPGEFVRTNVVGTFTLLESVRQYWMMDQKLDKTEVAAQRRFHHISTDEVYGSLGTDDPPFKETNSYEPNSPYSASKAGSDHLVRAYFHTYGLPVTTTNCSNNYGPYHFPEKLIPLTILNALSGERIPIYGNGKNVRDWLFVTDHAEAIRRVLKDGVVGQTYNVGGWNEKKNIDVVRTICAILDELKPSERGRYDEQIQFVADRPGHDIRYAIDASKLCNELGWRPSETFETGIRRTIEWYLNGAGWLSSVTQGHDESGLFGTDRKN